MTYRVSVRPPLVLGSLYSGRYVVGVDGFVFVVAVTGLSIGRLLYDELYDDPNVVDIVTGKQAKIGRAHV